MPAYLARFAVSRLLHSFLFEVNSLDPVAYIAVPALMGIIALAAAWIPARRAAAVDPLLALTKQPRSSPPRPSRAFDPWVTRIE